VHRLLRALYGLKQAGLAWWRDLVKSMVQDLGFTSIVSDACIYVYTKAGDFVLAAVYVDDAIFCGPNKAVVLRLKATFMKRWECRDLGEPTEFLGMRITRSGQCITINQRVYLDKLLERCGMTNAKPAPIPLPAGYIPKLYTGVVDPELHCCFQVTIGSLLYIMIGTRPDIAYAVTKLVQYSASPAQEHLNAALHICQYLVGTRKYELVYNGATGGGFACYANSDWDTDPYNKCRPQSGFFLELGNGAVTWTSRTQKTVALSSTEGEYMALSDESPVHMDSKPDDGNGLPTPPANSFGW
jgi:hypothetical protein